MRNIDLKTLTLFDLTLTCPPLKVRLDDVIGSNDCRNQYLRAKWPRNYIIFLVARHSDMPCDPTNILWLLFYNDLLWPDLHLNLFEYVLGTHEVSFVDFYPALWVSMSYLQPVQRNLEPKMWQRFARTFDLTLTWHTPLLLNVNHGLDASW